MDGKSGIIVLAVHEVEGGAGVYLAAHTLSFKSYLLLLLLLLL